MVLRGVCRCAGVRSTSSATLASVLLAVQQPSYPVSWVLQVRWITFHSGYDFGYLLKLLTCSSLPANEAEFFQLLKASAVSLS